MLFRMSINSSTGVFISPMTGCSAQAMSVSFTSMNLAVACIYRNVFFFLSSCWDPEGFSSANLAHATSSSLISCSLMKAARLKLGMICVNRWYFSVSLAISSLQSFAEILSQLWYCSTRWMSLISTYSCFSFSSFDFSAGVSVIAFIILLQILLIMLSRFSRSLRMMTTWSTAKYSTGQQAPAFKLPKQWEITGDVHDEMRNWILYCDNSDMIANLLKDNVKYTTAEWLGEMYTHMARYEFELTKSFYGMAIPITKEYLKVYTRENATSLGQIAINSAILKVDDAEFWDLIFQKLYDDKIVRYVTLPVVAGLYSALVQAGIKLDHPLYPTLLAIMKQQQVYYDTHPELKTLVQTAAKAHQVAASKKSEKPVLGEADSVKKAATTAEK